MHIILITRQFDVRKVNPSDGIQEQMPALPGSLVVRKDIFETACALCNRRLNNSSNDRKE